jgi:dTDP-4-dehydrorhamnose 3,5-epimerase
MSRFIISDTPLEGVKLLQRKKMGDERGYLSRLFCASDLVAAGWMKPVAQINQTLTTTRGTVRGMHYQESSHAEMKVISCLVGEVWDVAVDIRVGSSTFLQWHAVRLSQKNMYSYLIPEGVAHGFQTLTDDVQLVYVHSEQYAPEAEAGLNPCDPNISIAWPLPISAISPRDKVHPFVDCKYKGVSL